MDNLDINNIMKINELNNELEYEKASSLYLQLRKLEQEDSSYPKIRQQLKKLILGYEQKHWTDESKISESKVKESDLAEILIQAENEFNYRRKELIKNKLKESGINQNDLAKILGHRKSYMSELINGFRPFSKEDIVIINRLLKIKLEDLVPTFIKQDKAAHIKNILKSIEKSKIKLTKKDFDLQLS
jgi:plasmid maintenance system antidote protein VapI